jgi:hypothetical protein
MKIKFLLVFLCSLGVLTSYSKPAPAQTFTLATKNVALQNKLLASQTKLKNLEEKKCNITLMQKITNFRIQRLRNRVNKLKAKYE